MQLDCTGYIAEHKVGNKVVVPGATFMQAALAACARSDGGENPIVFLKKGFVLRPCHVDPGQKTIDLILQYSDSERYCEIAFPDPARPQKPKTIFRGDVGTSSTLEPFDFDLGSTEFEISGEEIYAYTKEVSIQYGPLFTRLHSVEVAKNFGRGLLKVLPEDLGRDFLMHPTLLDAAFHICGAVVYTKDHPDFRPGVPARIQSLSLDTRISPSADSKVVVECIMHEGLEPDHQTLLADLQIYCDDKLWAVIKGLRLIRVDPQSF